MDSSEAGAGVHGDERLRRHRHVDKDPIAFLHPLRFERPGKKRNSVQKVSVSESLLRVGDGAVVDEGRLVGPPVFHVPVQAVETRVHLAV